MNKTKKKEYVVNDNNSFYPIHRVVSILPFPHSPIPPKV